MIDWQKHDKWQFVKRNITAQNFRNNFFHTCTWPIIIIKLCKFVNSKGNSSGREIRVSGGIPHLCCTLHSVQLHLCLIYIYVLRVINIIIDINLTQVEKLNCSLWASWWAFVLFSLPCNLLNFNRKIHHSLQSFTIYFHICIPLPKEVPWDVRKKSTTKDQVNPMPLVSFSLLFPLFSSSLLKYLFWRGAISRSFAARSFGFVK
jgi:hypothetical protein